jgi:hypothetical protein
VDDETNNYIRKIVWNTVEYRWEKSSGVQVRKIQWSTSEKNTVEYTWEKYSGVQVRKIEWSTGEKNTVEYRWEKYSGVQVRKIQWSTGEKNIFLLIFLMKFYSSLCAYKNCLLQQFTL